VHLHYLQHVPFEGPGCIADWAEANGHQLTATRLHMSEQPPQPAEIDWLIVMGGPMNIYEEEQHPWLAEEKACILAALETKKTVLGICLGAQLIADVLGGPVSSNLEPEIGWFPLTLTEEAVSLPLLAGMPRELQAFHWHGDTFALPPGSTLLASSEACTNQAFLYNSSVLGFQFHLEMRFHDAERLITNCRDEIGYGPYMQTPDEMLAKATHFQEANRQMFTILDRLAAS